MFDVADTEMKNLVSKIKFHNTHLKQAASNLSLQMQIYQIKNSSRKIEAKNLCSVLNQSRPHARREKPHER